MVWRVPVNFRRAPEGFEHVTLHLQIGRDVAVGCGDAGVAEIITDDGDIDAGLQQRHGTAVPAIYPET